VPLAVPGTSRIGRWRIEAAVLRRPPHDLRRRDGGALAYLDAGAVGERLSLRRRRDGDRFQPLGLARPKKLQDFFVDARVPREERDAIPLLVSRRGVAWVAGQRPAEWAKVTPATRRVLRLRAVRQP
jgi:tRNA(Ile)-lysidine synthase